jgi:hypothetical protein
MARLLTGQVQCYEWGVKGRGSGVAQLWSQSTDPVGIIEESKPYAEFW